MWAKLYDGPGHDTDSAFALGVSPDGSKVFVTGVAWSERVPRLRHRCV